MANFRTVQTSFWTDPKIMDDFTPEDRLFYFYLLTNPYTNLCGCYEISVKQMANEMGFSVDTIKSMIKRFEGFYNMIRYSSNKELIVLNWHKYNWTGSPKMRVAIENEIHGIKTVGFKKYLTDVFNGIEAEYPADDNETNADGYGMDRVSIPYQKNANSPISISNTISNSNSNTNTSNEVLDNIQNTESKTNKSNDTKKKAKSNFKELIDAYTANQDLREALYEFVKMRKSMKKGFTEHMLKLNLNILDKLAYKDEMESLADIDKLKCDIVNQSLANQWLGFWELKGGPKEPELPGWYSITDSTPVDDELLQKALMLQKGGAGNGEQSNPDRKIDKGPGTETNVIRSNGQFIQSGC